MRAGLALSAVGLIVALLVVPPFISVRRYKSRITQIISASVGRPVRLSSVELRILPRPSFVITDLIVEEDPAYGSEPMLHANTVIASIRMVPWWWRARLEISRISVDEASLNLVRTAAGRWNLDSFFRTAARVQAGPGNSGVMAFPYLEATDSRVNIKDGVEKLPFSLVNADLAVWQESSGEWRVRLKGQPARTDVSLDLADTGIVRLEGRLERAQQLRRMPIHLDVDWREAQLGQLSRLVLGNDQGWRGDLTGEVHIDGSADAATVNTRLRASGVHRAEFAPASPIDFDASCSFVYHYSERGVEKLECNSPVGNGRARLTGEVPGRGPAPRLSFEVDKVPAQIALDMLRTVRSGLDPSLQAAGTISGRIDYARGQASAPATPARHGTRAAKTHGPVPGPLSGSLTVSGLRISGDSLSRPLLIPKVTVDPAPNQPPALVANVAVPLGAPTPLNFTGRLTMDEYQIGIRGGAPLPRLRELAHVAGVAHAAALDKVEGPAATLDLTANGPWLHPPASAVPDVSGISSANPTVGPSLVASDSDHISGTVTLHAVTWKPEFLANPVEIANATVRLDDTGASWDPVAFSYGPVSGSATLKLAAGCLAGRKCTPQFTAEFGSLDAASVQAALLGARESDTMLSSLLGRLRTGQSAGWPELEGTARANSMVIGAVTLEDAAANLHLGPDGAEIQSFDAGLLGGRIHLQGSILPGNKPDYKLEGRFDQVNAAELGKLLGMTWSGNAIDGTGKVELGGFTDKDLAASANGSLHFDWRRGAVTEKGEGDIPPALARFDRWSGDAEIASGAITLKQNAVQQGGTKLAVAGSATFDDPPRVTFGESQETRAADTRQTKP
jgi:hypothetical protein